jgi:hypothetical protein
MQTAHDMTKDQSFRLRLDATDRERLKAVAAHFSAPESTAVRILIKEKYDALALQRAQINDDDFRWEDLHREIVGVLADDTKREPMPTDEIYRCLSEGENRGGGHYGHSAFKTAIPRALNALTRNGYMRRLKSGYVLTPKGSAKADQ